MKTFILFIILIFSPLTLANQSFSDFIKDIKIEAKKKGINPKTVDELFGKNPTPSAFTINRYKVRDNSKSQVSDKPKTSAGQKFNRNQKRYLSKTRLAKAKKLMRDKRIMDILAKVEAKYGVDKEAIVALWSIESYFGLNQGGHNVPKVLATLAWYKKEKRKAMFKRELFNALKIYEAGHVTKENFTGSWAGAMGQIQFLPSTFLAYAEDGDGDGKADIWTNEADAFASAANYLKSLGWQKNKAWKNSFVLNKKITGNGIFYETGLSKQRVFARNKQGYIIYKHGKGVVRKFDVYMLKLKVLKRRGVPIPKNLNLTDRAYLFLPHGNKVKSKGYILHKNFHVILSWNRSSYFAFGILSIMDKLKEDQTLNS